MLYMHCEVPCTYVRLWVARNKKKKKSLPLLSYLLSPNSLLLFIPAPVVFLYLSGASLMLQPTAKRTSGESPAGELCGRRGLSDGW